MSVTPKAADKGIPRWIAQTFCIENVNLKFSAKQKKKIPSMGFFYRHNPESPSFTLEFHFGTEEEGHMGVFVYAVDKEVIVTKFKVGVYDDDGKFLAMESLVNQSHLLKKGNGWGLRNVYKTNDSSKEKRWRVTFEFEYRELATLAICDEPHSNLKTDLLKLLDNPASADVTFLVQGEPIKAHKNILTVRCDYFQKMFQSDTQEKASDEVQVPDVKPDVFKGMLQFLYSDSQPKNFVEIALDLLLVADKYCLTDLKKLCESQVPLSSGNIVDALVVADQINSEKLMIRSKAIFRSSFDNLMQSDGADKLKCYPGLLLKLLSHYVKE